MFRHAPAACACLLLLAGCQPAPEETTAPRPVWVMTITEDTAQLTQTGHYTGEVRSRYASSIGFRMAGKIIARSVNVGDLVHQGQRIAQLDARDTQLNAEAAQAEVNAAQASLALAKAELTRRQQLYQKQFISQSALDSYTTQLSTAQARLQQAQAQAAVSQHQTGYTALLADRSGVIGMIQAEPGQVVTAGQTIAQIHDLHALEVQIAIPEHVITALHVGDAASVRLDAAQVYPGRIREIAAVANPQTRAFDVRIQLLQPDSRIRLGMTAEVNLTGLQPGRDIVVPSTAVTYQAQQHVVWIIDDQQRAHLRQVSTAELSEDGIRITAGLQAGDRIATIGVHTLTEGMLVQPVRPTPEVLR